MSTVENKTIIQEAFRAWANGAGMAFFNLLADTAIWTVMGSCPISGTYIGRQGLVENALIPQREKLVGPPTPTLLNLIAEGDMVVIQWVGKGTTKAGQPYNQLLLRRTHGKWKSCPRDSVPRHRIGTFDLVMSANLLRVAAFKSPAANRRILELGFNLFLRQGPAVYLDVRINQEVNRSNFTGWNA
jgi:ketosteroid isomerase-like protein